MFRERKSIIVLVSIVLVTALMAFALGGVITYGYLTLGPHYEIAFDKNAVEADNIKKFEQVRAILKNKYYESVDENKMLEGAVAGIADSLKDPYTVYFDKDRMKSFMEQTDGSYVGIGVSVTMDNNGLLTVVEPFEDSPAYKVGIKKDDRIIKVDDKDVTTFRDDSMIVKMIKGPENTKVKVTVFRPSENKSYDYEIQRKKIKTVNIKSEMLENNIGYIKLVMFDAEIASDFERHLNALISKGMKGLIIDVRDNPGGSYEQVVSIADRLLPKGTIVYTEDKNKSQDIKKSDDNQLNMPITVLTNGNSASASEILAGSLKDHKKATLVGTKTFGKGLVQELIPLQDGAGLKVTVARYFTPSGECIQGKGIQPDITVELPEKYNQIPVSQIPKTEDTQLKKAIEIIKGK